jgi:hypothetical protein
MPTGKATKRKRTAAPASAAASTPKAAITPTAAVTSPTTEAFAVQCSHKSELLDINEDIYINLWGPECDDATRDAEDSATGFAGTWVWDSEPIKSGCQYYDYRKKVEDRKKSFLGGKGRPVLFQDRAAAEAAAFSFWQGMLQAQDRPTKPLQQQLEEQTAILAPKKGAAKKRAAASAGDQQTDAYQQLLSRFHTSAEGLSAWQADVEWWDDPDSCGDDARFKNVVLTTIRVEVIKASIV